MAVFKCKMCGGDLIVVENSTVCECEYCGTKQTIPKNNDENIANLFNRANRLRIHCEFDKAEEIYEKIINIDDKEAEAHWGLVLCKYGIEYVEDPVTFERVPTCHRASYEAVTEDNDYLSAISNANDTSKNLYEIEAKKIEELQQRILAKTKDEKPFDVFICYKETTNDGERTEDSVLAQDIYDVLVDKGFNVFFSRITLENKLGQEYEPYIFSALNSSKVMLVIGTKPEYVNAIWVRNEWSRFLKQIKKDSSKLLIPCYKDMDPYDLPEAFAHLQAQNLGKIGAIQDLVRGISKVITTGDSSAAMDNANENLLNDAFSLLEDGNFKTAKRHFETIEKADPKNPRVYVGKLMVELKLKQFTAKEFAFKNYKHNENYSKAMEYGDEFVKEKFASFKNYKANKIKKTVLLFSIIVVSMFVAALSALNLYKTISYDNYVEEFCTGSANYSLLEIKFSQLNGFKSSDMLEMYCGAKIGKVYPDVKEIKYDVSLNKINDWNMNEYFPNIETIIVDKSVDVINSGVFKNLTKLKKVYISNGVESISDSAFEGCTALKEIYFSDSLTNIGGAVFQDCTALEKVVLPDSLISIGNNAFKHCASLKKIDLPGNLTSMGGAVFQGCTSLEEIALPDSLTSMGNYVFQGCTALKEITLSDSLTSMGSFVFQGCTSLEEIALPDSLTSMGNYVFQGCTALKKADISGSVNNIGLNTFSACTSLVEVILSDSITSIEQNAFSNCTSLKEITLPDSLTEISAAAFVCCSSLEKVIIPKSVSSIGLNAFWSCNKLKTIYCEVDKKPQGWNNQFYNNSKTKIVWGYTK